MNHDDVYYALQDKLHDKEARIRELEGLLRIARHFVVEPKLTAFTALSERFSGNRFDCVKRIDRALSSRKIPSPPDSEPATPPDQTAVDDLVAEYERDPAKREAIDEARTRLNNNEPAEEAEKCLVCDGTGNLYRRQPEGMYGYTHCHNCKGTGKPPIREPAGFDGEEENMRAQRLSDADGGQRYE